MKRFLLIIFLFPLFISGATAQPVMRDVFAAMPDSVLPLVTKNNRLDCIDFIENHMEAKVRNAFDEYVTLEALTTDYARFRTSPVSVMEMKLLSLSDSVRVLCLVTTAETGDTASTIRLCDSNIRFLREDWSELAADSAITCAMPDVYQFIVGETADSVKTDFNQAVQSLRNLHPVRMALSADEPALTLTLQTALLSKEERRAVADRLRPLILRWVNGKFE